MEQPEPTAIAKQCTVAEFVEEHRPHMLIGTARKLNVHQRVVDDAWECVCTCGFWWKGNRIDGQGEVYGPPSPCDDQQCG